MKTKFSLFRDQLRFALHGDKSTILWTAKFSGVLLVFLVLFYPVQRELGIAGSNENSLKEQVEGLKIISTNLLSDKELTDTQLKLEQFGQRIVDTSQAAALLDLITAEAETNHLNVIQIYSDSPQPAKDDQGRELEFDGHKLFWIGVNFRVESDFKSLGNFLKTLNDKSQWEYVVESMVLQKTPQADSLQCDLTLNFIAR